MCMCEFGFNVASARSFSGFDPANFTFSLSLFFIEYNNYLSSAAG